ncbi:hypothetical protein NQ317_016594 [Molorchus minor]|uniref:Uncharacterized protein n=1 Tax=Molorchus minor TaxID=1323400 RepID=A0ABQ9ITL7_9CUCU|nr:hypothetical protein NQ317_016594 [Molorchus minor]
MSFSKYYLSLKGDVKSRYDAKIQLIDNVDPYSLGANELNRNLSFLPTVSIMDMFLYWTTVKGIYKSLQAYKYYEAGFVKEVLAKKVHENAICGHSLTLQCIRMHFERLGIQCVHVGALMNVKSNDKNSSTSLKTSLKI